MERVITILRQLRRQMNGAVSASMTQHGLHYGLNYGVSLPTIASISKPYAPDSALAESLWRQDVRELKIAATYIADPQRVDMALMLRWGESFRTEEVARLAAMNLFHLSIDAESTSILWISGQDEFRMICAYYILGRMARSLNDESLDTLANISSASRPNLSQASDYALREIYKHHPSRRTEIQRLAHGNTELLWQLEYAL